MLFTILFILYILVAITMVIGLLLNGMRPSKTLAWLLAIFTIPVGGILLYLMLGRNRRKNKLLKGTNRKQLAEAGSPIRFDPSKNKYDKISSLIHKNCGFLPSGDNSLSLLKDGKTTFEAIFKAMENARSYIHLQYYIYEEGELADRLLSLFEEKIAKGVRIRLIYDGIGSFSLSASYLKRLKTMGVEVHSFLPFRFGRFLASVNYRNHRKIIVVDGKTAFTGGINISDKYLKGDLVLGKWHDMHVQITGTAVHSLDTVFAMDWDLVSNEKLDLPKAFPEREAIGRGAWAQIAASGPDDDFPGIEQLYFSMITTAREYLYITNPYIIPGQAILGALETAALSGVDVRLLISAQADSKLVNWSVRSYFESLLKAGVKIYLFPDGFLHSKIIISDDDISTIGTANIDIRSFEQNYEVNAVIYNRDFTVQLREDFIKDSTESTELNYEAYKKRPWAHKLKEGAAKIFSPIL
ncbi:cardiolipin synthase [Flavobacteriaceae bacterium 3-367]|uniref:cardiolipin synthase n=1 Tax=Eudoraea algarum TaxID=3417568 RepID=UPI003275FEF8